MQIIYGQRAIASKGRRQWRNARFFQVVEAGATAVFLDGDYPAIRAAYEAAGVPVHDGLEAPKVAPKRAKAKRTKRAAPTPAAPAPDPE